MLAILDYKAGNQTSVFRALASLGIASEITADPARLRAAGGVIFPGVGAAPQAMNLLTGTGLDKVLRSLVAQRVPLLGVCLGCQILLDSSEEGGTALLGVVPGQVLRFREEWRDGGRPLRIPHMGWNGYRLNPDAPEGAARILRGIDPAAQFYFVHSYYPRPDPSLAVAFTTYGQEFASVYGRQGLWAVQFHPEKSGEAGLGILANFAGYCREISQKTPRAGGGEHD